MWRWSIAMLVGAAPLVQTATAAQSPFARLKHDPPRTAHERCRNAAIDERAGRWRADAQPRSPSGVDAIMGDMATPAWLDRLGCEHHYYWRFRACAQIDPVGGVPTPEKGVHSRIVPTGKTAADDAAMAAILESCMLEIEGSGVRPAAGNAPGYVPFAG